MILLAGAEEVAAVAALDAAALPGEAWSEESWAGEAGSPQRRVLVAQDDAGALVAYADWLLPPVGSTTAELLKIGVAASRRREGIASALIEAGLRLVTEAGADEVLLEVAADNRAAVAAYRTLGFTTLARRERYYRDGTDALVMRLPLAVET